MLKETRTPSTQVLDVHSLLETVREIKDAVSVIPNLIRMEQHSITMEVYNRFCFCFNLI
jgi:hypothetical protein